jgi:hypothetical protein
MESGNKRMREEGESLNAKRTKVDEDDRQEFIPNIPMDFGTNRQMRRLRRGSDDEFVPQSINQEEVTQAINSSLKELGVEEERVNVKELYKLESKQKEEFNSWKKKEEEFEFKQMVLRSKIRLENNRPKHIDLLAKLYLILDSHIPISGDIKSEFVRYPYRL